MVDRGSWLQARAGCDEQWLVRQIAAETQRGRLELERRLADALIEFLAPAIVDSYCILHAFCDICLNCNGVKFTKFLNEYFKLLISPSLENS